MDASSSGSACDTLVRTGSAELAPCVVVERLDMSTGVAGLVLARADDQDFPVWTPGAHVDLVMGVDLVRQYSLWGDCADRRHLRVAVQLEQASRGGSRFVHESLHVGAEVSVRGPRNHFELGRADRYLFVAGGIGIVPLVPMIARLEAEGADWTMLYGGRSLDSMAFVPEVLAVSDQRVTVAPQDEHGLLDLAAYLSGVDSGTAVYCCGPTPLLDAVTELSRTWDAGAELHIERFTPRDDLDPDAPDAPVEVRLVRSGLTLAVAADTSILDEVQRAGINVLSSCEEGTCGTCESRVLAGIPEHRDSVLTDAERESNEYMMICVSRAKTPTLDLDL